MANEEQKNEELKKILKKREAVEAEIGKVKNSKLKKAFRHRFVKAKTEEEVEALYRELMAENSKA